MNSKINIAIVGATGMVGSEMVTILENRKFPVGRLYLLASSNSIGRTMLFNGENLHVIALENFDFSRVDLAFFFVGRAISRKYAPMAAIKNCIVIDNSSEFRYDKEIPLVVPEVNPETISYFRKKNIIANPNCSVIQTVVAMAPIHRKAVITRLNIATYQAVSGKGNKAIAELVNQIGAILNGHKIDCESYQKQIAFNVLPHIDSLEDNGYTREEMKMVWEIPRLMNDSKIQVNVTATRVPVFFGHSLAVHITTKDPITVEETKKLLRSASGVIVVDSCNPFEYPTPAKQGTSKIDAVYVGRIRRDLFNANALNVWIVANNIRKGGALNSIQIAEILLQKYL